VLIFTLVSAEVVETTVISTGVVWLLVCVRKRYKFKKCGLWITVQCAKFYEYKFRKDQWEGWSCGKQR